MGWRHEPRRGRLAIAEDGPAPTAPAYVATVDSAAFREKPLEHQKLGATVRPAAVRMITPGVSKSDIYRWIGAPHFGEGITRRWNYVLFFPAAPGSSRASGVSKIRAAPAGER